MHVSFTLALIAGTAASLAAQIVQEERPAEAGAQAPVVRYDGHRSVRVTVHTSRQLMTVLALTDDVLTCEGAGIGTFDVRFSPEQYAAFLETEIAHEVLIEDLQAHIDAWRTANEAARQGDSGWYDAFRDLLEVETRVDGLVAAHPALTTLSVIGQSLEERPIRMIRVTGAGGTLPPEERPAIVINGTQHSRESLSPMTTIYFMEYLLENYATDPRITAILDGIDFYFVPMVNPDGYVHVWGPDPMWRKNRREVPGSNCMGVDLNRNWGFQWGQSGSSGNPCNQTYRGDGPFSEPETQAIGSVVDMLGSQQRLAAHMDVHSYATKFLSPWGYTEAPPPDLIKMNFLGAQMRNAIATHRGTWYEYGQGSIILYVVSGGSRDYSYGTYGSMGWTIELPGTSFHPPPSEILPVAEETTLGLLALAEYYLPVTTTGACCVPGTGCIVIGEGQCAAANGDYHGDNSTCTSCPDALTTASANAGMSANGGIFLNLTAHQAELDVVRIDTHANTGAGEPFKVEIWTYPGTYVGNDTDPTGWTLHDTVETTSEGTNIPTALRLNTPLALTPGQTTGIYLIGREGGVRYTNPGTGGQVIWSNDDLTLYSHRARTAPWGGNLWSPRCFAGSIHYSVPANCYADCDESGSLNIDDFLCFINEFAQAQSLPPAQQITHYANCTGSTSEPILTIDDFLCFINEFAAGCP